MLCSERAQKLVTKACTSDFRDPLDQFTQFYDFFCYQDGLEEFMTVLKYLSTG